MNLARALGCTIDYLCGLSDYPETLPPGQWLVDQALYDRVTNGAVAAPDESFGCPIPAGARIVDSTTYHRMLQEMRAKLTRKRKS